MDLISVIVPVYKVEPYLDRCVQSIVDQTYTNLEIILVDDGSPDNCGAMCDEWARRDSRVRVIHKVNGGLSDARNAGMEIASGEYVAFVDSDDWLESAFIENLYTTLIQYHCEAVGCAYIKSTGEDPAACIAEPFDVRIMDCITAVSELIDNRAVQQVVWNKLYQKKLIEDIPFEKGKHHEDEFWSYQVFGRIKSYAVIDYWGYHYFQRPDSIMGISYSFKRLDAVEAKVRRQEYLQAHLPELAGKGRINLLFTCLYHGQLAILYVGDKNQKAAFDVLSAARRQYPLTNDDKRSMPLKQRVWAILSEISFITACKLRNCLKIGL